MGDEKQAIYGFRGTDPDLVREATAATYGAIEFIEEHREGPFFIYLPPIDSFKNLFVYTKMRNVAGIQQTQAQKAHAGLAHCGLSHSCC